MTEERLRPLVAGNWKMNGSIESLAVLEEIKSGYGMSLAARAELLVCPPATLIHPFAVAALGSGVAIGGQDSHAEPAGAFTGNISAEMLADLGATYVILGHSERRAYHRESDEEVQGKALGMPHDDVSGARPGRRSRSWPARCTARSLRAPRLTISWLPMSRSGRSAPG
jgi:triosephosphate isomerase